MISINNLTLSFGSYNLLDDISFHISEGEHIALVGKNGAGKSTILKLIVGQDAPTIGSIVKPSGLSIGYLPQILDYSKDKSIIDETMLAFAEIFSMKDRLSEINNELVEREDYESDAYKYLIEELNDINDRLSILDSGNPRVIAEKTLLGLGFKRKDLERNRGTFSQGWNMRVELAKVLLRKPDVLLLDEPTNHLDIESIQWLEDYLKSYPGSLVLISHDRTFLDKVTTRTVEIVLSKIHDYKVPYSKYVKLREERMEQQRATYENQQRMIEKTEEFIERFRYKASKANQVQSRVKQLDKLERVEIDEVDTSRLNVKFPPAPRSGQVVFQTKNLVGGYRDSKPEKIVFADVDLVIERGEKIAFVGRNGEGKSTMMKLIMKELNPLEGVAELGYNVSLGYFAQNQEDILDSKQTVLETLDSIAVGEVRFKLRDILAAFLFKGEDIDKKVGVLSGGERSRLAMAKLMLHPYNILALDEPTNHMDIRSKDVLKQALINYDGTLILVSHDRDFLDGLVDKVYEFADGRVREHIGGINNFLERKKFDNLKEVERSVEVSNNIVVDKKEEVKESKLSYNEQKETRRIQKRLESCEKAIIDLEAKLKKIEEDLSMPDSKDIEALMTDYAKLKLDLEMKMEEWMEFEQ